MSKRDILIEIGLEEMPARFVTEAAEQFTSRTTHWFIEKNIPFGEVKSFSTPRRLAVLILDVAEKQEDVHTEAKGPAKKIALDQEGNWSKAAAGFTRGQGATVEDIYFKEIGGIEYAHVNKFIKGEETLSLLGELQHVITGLNFPKNMKWGSHDLRFVRPIKWIVAMFGDDVVPFSITDVDTGRKTMGHRFLGTEIEMATPANYPTALLTQFVIADPAERKEAIRSQLSMLEQENGWTIPVDEGLLEEVNNLIEYPTALYGKFEEEFLSLPEDVLITSMKEHQRYFPVRSKTGELLPFFVTVRNGDHNHIANVARGNEKVLRARLSDASFFYKEDQKLDIEKAVEKLDSIVYQVELGSLGDKVRRVREMSKKLGRELQLSPETIEKADRAAHIAKFDLVSNMVYEFPELQGFMGERYARLKGEDKEVAAAINEHYMPRSADDEVPPSDIGALVSVADKMDTIAGSFLIGLIPTGSQDPYALRRQAAGIVQIVIEKNWKLDIEKIIHLSLENFPDKQANAEGVFSELVTFFKMRLQNELKERNVRHDIIEAVLGTSIGQASLLIQKAEVLERKKEDSSFKGVAESLSRVLNIAKKGERREIDSSLFQSEEEKALYSAYQQARKAVEDSLSGNQAEAAFESLQNLRETIDQYFDNTMVMAEDEAIKNNRLAQMVHLADVILSYANFNAILVK